MTQSEKQSLAILAAFIFTLVGIGKVIVKPITAAKTAARSNSAGGVQKDEATLMTSEAQTAKAKVKYEAEETKAGKAKAETDTNALKGAVSAAQ